MCLTFSHQKIIDWNIIANKSKFVKAVTNIIRKLKTISGAKKEKYLNIIRTEFNLAKDERWVITKLRMMLVQLDAGMELLEIRKSEKLKMKKTKKTSSDVSNLCSSLTKSIKTSKQTSNQTKKTKKPRKSLETRQLEKLRNMSFGEVEELDAKYSNKQAFLMTLDLHPKVVYL